MIRRTRDDDFKFEKEVRDRRALGIGHVPHIVRIATVSVFFLFYIVILTYSLRVSSDTTNFTLILLGIYVVVLSVPILLTLGETRLGFLAPPVIVSLLAMVGLARQGRDLALGLSSHVGLSASTEALGALKSQELALASTGFLAYLLGYWILGGTQSRASGRQVFGDWGNSTGSHRVRSNRIRGVILGTSLLGLLYIAMQDGSIIDRLDRMAGPGGRHDALGGGFYISALLSAGLPACWLWFAEAPKRRAKSIEFWILYMISLIVAYVLTGQRSTFIYSGLILLVIWVARRGKVPIFGAAVVVVGGLYLIGSLSSVGSAGTSGYLDSLVQERGNPADVLSRTIEDEIIPRSTTRDGTLPILASVPTKEDYLYGQSYLAVALMPVPRALWRDKPTLIDGLVGRTFFGTNAGIPPGAVGESYWNFGTAGVALVFALFGAVHRGLATWMARRYKSPFALSAYAAILVLIPSPVSSSFVGAMPALFTLWLVGYFAVRSGAGSSAPVVGPDRRGGAPSCVE